MVTNDYIFYKQLRHFRTHKNTINSEVIINVLINFSFKHFHNGRVFCLSYYGHIAMHTAKN